MNFKFLGLLVIFIGILIKVILRQVYPNAILIDLCRISFFIGLGIIIFGFIRKK